MFATIINAVVQINSKFLSIAQASPKTDFSFVTSLKVDQTNESRVFYVVA